MISSKEVSVKSAHLKQLWVNKLRLRCDFMTVFGYLVSCPPALLWTLKMCTHLKTQAYTCTCLCSKPDLLSFSSEEGPLAGRTWKNRCSSTGNLHLRGSHECNQSHGKTKVCSGCLALRVGVWVPLDLRTKGLINSFWKSNPSLGRGASVQGILQWWQ